MMDILFGFAAILIDIILTETYLKLSIDSVSSLLTKNPTPMFCISIQISMAIISDFFPHIIFMLVLLHPIYSCLVLY